MALADASAAALAHTGEGTVTDTEVDIMLASQDESGGEYNVSHILIGLPDGSTPQQISEAQAKADDIHERLLGGLDLRTGRRRRRYRRSG